VYGVVDPFLLKYTQNALKMYCFVHCTLRACSAQQNIARDRARTSAKSWFGAMRLSCLPGRGTIGAKLFWRVCGSRDTCSPSSQTDKESRIFNIVQKLDRTVINTNIPYSATLKMSTDLGTSSILPSETTDNGRQQ